MSFNPIVLTSKTTFMQRVLHRVSKGYQFYVTGSFQVDKAGHVVEKFVAKYRINANVNQRSYAKRLGKSNVCLVMYHNKQNSHIDFALLATKGESDFFKEERPKNALSKEKKDRLKFYVTT